MPALPIGIGIGLSVSTRGSFVFGIFTTSAFAFGLQYRLLLVWLGTPELCPAITYAGRNLLFSPPKQLG